MESKEVTGLLGLLHDAAAKQEEYLDFDASNDVVKETLKDELFLVLEDIQVFTLAHITNNQEEE